jgi:hypothetical protein
LGDFDNIKQIGVKDGVKEQDVTKNLTIDVTKQLTERQFAISEMVAEDSFVTISEMSLKTGVGQELSNVIKGVSLS